jgi:hypothetical protein
MTQAVTPAAQLTVTVQGSVSGERWFLAANTAPGATLAVSWT